MYDATSLLHATCIAVNGNGALVMGPPGSGKSDLALRCLMQPPTLNGRGCQAVLIADDQVVLERHGERILCRTPGTIAGKLEVRGIGIVDVPFASEADLRIVVRLASKVEIARFPDPPPTIVLLGMSLPLLEVAPFEASAPLKVFLSLERLAR